MFSRLILQYGTYLIPRGLIFRGNFVSVSRGLIFGGLIIGILRYHLPNNDPIWFLRCKNPHRETRRPDRSCNWWWDILRGTFLGPCLSRRAECASSQGERFDAHVVVGSGREITESGLECGWCGVESGTKICESIVLTVYDLVPLDHPINHKRFLPRHQESPASKNSHSGRRHVLWRKLPGVNIDRVLRAVGHSADSDAYGVKCVYL